MKMLKILSIAVCSLVISQVSYAFNSANDNVLKLTIRNNTSEMLYYTGVTHTSPGSVFMINTTVIFPHGEAVVTCTNSPYYDLSGELHFTDVDGNGNLLTVMDRRLLHYGQPVFSMFNNQFVSFVESKVFNSEGRDNPRALSYVAATVILEKNPAPQDEDHK